MPRAFCTLSRHQIPGSGLSRRPLSYHRRPPQPTSIEMAKLLSKYATSPPRPINLSKLLSFGRPVTRNSVLDSVSYALAEIPRRLAMRVRSLEALPFIVGTNPYVAKTLNAYRDSFQTLATHPPVSNPGENAKFTELLTNLVQSHANDIPTMAKGFQECSRYMSPTQISNFLDSAIRSRISVRLIAEQHIALTHALNDPNSEQQQVGVVDMHCSPKKMIQMCGSFVTELCEATLGASPVIIIDGAVDSTFAYIPIHLEYILTEILKNSFRATVEQHMKQLQNTPKPLPPVTVTLSPPAYSPLNRPTNRIFSLRIRDQGGGVSPANMARIFSYAFTTAGRGACNSEVADEETDGPYAAQRIGGAAAVGEGKGPGDVNLFGEITGKGLQTGLGTIAGLGYGLPMSRLYARYFGGSLDLLSLEGWGTDVVLKLRCLDGDLPDNSTI
ncbi:hypothetical protein AX17_003332 [Amanita inopinata Kibby_2008]|nr:hypothetical protein AX17_003332 [Amanita inopinata Kibby_2008]